MTKSDTKKPTLAQEVELLKDDCAQLHAIVEEQNKTIAAMRAQIQQLCSVAYTGGVKPERVRFG